MRVYDFEYDGELLSSKGFIICKFDSSGTDTVTNGSELSFNTVSTQRGAKHELTSVAYEDCLTATFQICKHPCYYSVDEITIEEMRDIMRWLNRKEFHKFSFTSYEYVNIYFEASFNVNRIEVGGRLCGFELEMFTNSPFAFYKPVRVDIKNLVSNGTKTIVSQSDEEGYIYPQMEITVNASGDLEIYNDIEDRTMFIKNCKQGEVIKLDYPVIETSLASHKIQNDFNWRFLRIAKTYRENANHLTISLPCTIKLTYTPRIKIGL